VLVYVLIPTSKGQAVMESLASRQAAKTGMDERLEQAAQSLTALLKCTSCVSYALESDDLVLEIELVKSSWVN
jgi:hypothetical protein